MIETCRSAFKCFNVWHFKLMIYYTQVHLLDHYTQWKFWIFDASSWLFYTKFVTMHSHLNIKIQYSIYSTAALIWNNTVTVDVTATKCITNIYIQCGQYAVSPVLNETKLSGIWWSNFSLRITCHVSICNSLPAQIRSVTYSNPLAMTPLLSETLLCALTCYAACYVPRNLCTQYINFNASELIPSTLQKAVRNGTTVRVKPWSGERS
jgi:hypothetical protein